MKKNIVPIDKNPACMVDKFMEKSRERFIQPSEFSPLLDAINGYPDERMHAFSYCACTPVPDRAMLKVCAGIKLIWI